MCEHPTTGNDWLGLTDAELPIGEMYDWCVRPDCGAVVLFSGTVRDHAEGRTDVTHLEYEAYDEMVVPKLDEIVAETRARWPEVGRLALVHRIGRLGARREFGRRRGVRTASTGGVRSGAVRDRRTEGVGAGLETRDLVGRFRLGHQCRRSRRGVRGRQLIRIGNVAVSNTVVIIVVVVAVVVVAIAIAARRAAPTTVSTRSGARSMPCRPRRGGP